MKRTFILLMALALSYPLSSLASDEVTEVDLSVLTDRGMLMRVLTDGRPVWIAYRTEKAISKIQEQAHIHYQGDPASIDKGLRSVNRDYFIVFGGCPKGDELPAYYPDDGFVCPSDCGAFDMAGRPINECAGALPMDIPAHTFKDAKTVVIPIHQDGALNKQPKPTP
jgi:Rieske Fe-S protein